MYTLRFFWYLLLSLCFFLLSCAQQKPSPQIFELKGTGLHATYFADADFSSIRRSRIDRHIYFDWQTQAPLPDLSSSRFSARWEADLIAPKSGTYQLFLSTTGRASLSLNGQLLSSGKGVYLKAGERNALVLEFVKTEALAQLKLEWQFESAGRELIPQQAFYPKLELASLAVVPGVNLLSNPDFTIDTGSWIAYGTGSKNSISPGRDGSGKAMELANWAWVQQNIAVSDIEIAQTYTLKGYAKASPASVCTLAIAGGGSAGESLNQKLLFTSTTWQEQGLVFSMPASTSWAAVYVTSQSAACQFDDISLIAGSATPPPPPASSERMNNGGFEAGLNGWQVFGGSSLLSDDARVGSKALRASNFNWIQQNIAISALEPGSSYSFSAFAKTSQTCTVGLVMASTSAVVLSKTLNFNRDNWQHQFVDLQVPAGLAWAAVYIASAAADCYLDGLSLYKEPDLVNPAADWVGESFTATEQGSLTLALDLTGDVLYGDIINYGHACSFKALALTNRTANQASGTVSGIGVEATIELNLRTNFIAGSFSYSSGSCQGQSRSFTVFKSVQDPLLDAELRLLLFQNAVTPLSPSFSLNQQKVDLGRLLFHDKELSGNRDISCATCHSAGRATVDQLALSIGTKGTGAGAARQLGADRQRSPRHAMDLFNRGLDEFSHMFWDGRVNAHPQQGFSSPLAQLPAGLESALAVQALFPLLNRLEMRGNVGDIGVTDLANELAAFADNNPNAIWNAIMLRLLAIPGYQQKFSAAYPNVAPANLTIAHVANALAEFQKDAFTTLNSPFDRYLFGDNTALTEDQKLGALVFYGIGKCAVCHSGALQTDQKFHNIAVPQLGPGIGASALDFGRFLVTANEVDRFAFKTPSLRNVTLTAPYMHNGAFTSLAGAVSHYHLIEDSLRDYDPNQLEPSLRSSVKNDAATINQILATLSNDAKNLPLEGRTNSLVTFLTSLTDPRASNLADQVPASVPSGLPVND